MTAPELSVVVAVHNMAREAPRTLLSLSSTYQTGIVPSQYEVIVVDNGSDEPLGSEWTKQYGSNFSYVYVHDAPRSPAAAMNRGADLARATRLCLMIDGARIASPGLLAAGLAAMRADPGAMIETLGFHLGPDQQPRSIRRGYDTATEDDLIAEIGWPNDGYRLFDIASFGGSCSRGWYGPMNETNCLFIDRATYGAVGGHDERFDQPGGGLVNLDLYRRLVEELRLQPVRLLGEATFHQVHGGAATGSSGIKLRRDLRRWKRQYEKIRGYPYRDPRVTPTYFGETGTHAQPWIDASERLWAQRPERHSHEMPNSSRNRPSSSS